MEEAPNITPFPGQNVFASQQPVQAEPADGIDVLTAIAAVLNARLLALIALIGSVGVWLWAAYDPTALRLYAGLGVSFGVLVPCLIFAHKRG